MKATAINEVNGIAPKGIIRTRALRKMNVLNNTTKQNYHRIIIGFVFFFVSLIGPALVLSDQDSEKIFKQPSPQSGRTIKIGLYENPPKIFIGKSGHASGFFPELIDHIAEKEGWKLRWVPGTWKECLERLANNEIDIMPDTGWTESRSKMFAFNQETALLSWTELYVKKGSHLESFLDLKGKTIAGLAGSFNLNGPGGIKDITTKFEIDCKFLELDDYVDVFNALENGDADIGITNKDFGALSEGKFDVQRTSIILQPARMQFALTKNATLSPYLIEKIDTHLRALKKNNKSIYYQALDKWFGQHEIKSFVPKWLVWAGLIGAGLLAVMFLGNILLKKQVRSKTFLLENEIEKKKQTEKELFKAKEEWRQIFESVGHVTLLLNDQYEIISANSAACKATMLSAEDMVGKKCYEVFHRLNNAPAECPLSKMIHSKGIETMEMEVEALNGTFLVSCMPVVDDSGKINKIIHIATDITKLKETENNLRKSEQKFRATIADLDEGFYSSTLDGVLLDHNRSFNRILGFDLSQDLIGIKLPDFWQNPDDRKEYIEELTTKGSVTDYLINAKTVNGKKISIMANSHVVSDESGSSVRIDGTFLDYTERQSLQAQLLQAQKMESIGRLAGGVAHDYNNALSAIIGFTEIAIDDVDPEGPVRDNLDEVLKAAKHATDITRQLLAFARKQNIQPRSLDLNENVEGALKMLRRLIGEDIDLVWQPRAGLWPIWMDPSQIDQILANLCVNARDAIEDVGKVTIETDTVVFDKDYCADHSGFVPGKFVKLSVSDNGCGMDQTVLGMIFEPFFTTKDVDEGTGLGLATVYGIVKQNNGFINVYSEPGKGSTFKIYLPRFEGKVVEIQEESKLEIPKSRGETILIVEDDLTILKLAQKILEKLGYTVLTASTPGEALSQAEEFAGKIHLLVTDVVMPEMNGRELAERLQSLYPSLKNIFMSGYTANAISHRGVLEAGVYFIQKPFSQIDFAIVVRKVLDKAND